MIPLPKPRGFWDYALFALVLTGALVGLFRLEASDRIGWADAGLALAAAVFCVLAIILSRRNENASWIVRPTWQADLLATFRPFLLMFGAIYADAYVLHHVNITPGRLRREMLLGIVTAIAIFLSLCSKNTAWRRSP
jgi:hypothetical protein